MSRPRSTLQERGALVHGFSRAWFRRENAWARHPCLAPREGTSTESALSRHTNPRTDSLRRIRSWGRMCIDALGLMQGSRNGTVRADKSVPGMRGHLQSIYRDSKISKRRPPVGDFMIDPARHLGVSRGGKVTPDLTAAAQSDAVARHAGDFPLTQKQALPTSAV